MTSSATMTSCRVRMSIKLDSGAVLQVDLPIKTQGAQLQFLDHLAAGVTAVRDEADSDRRRQQATGCLGGLEQMREEIVMSHFHAKEDLSDPMFNLIEKSNESSGSEEGNAEKDLPSPITHKVPDNSEKRDEGDSLPPPQPKSKTEPKKLSEDLGSRSAFSTNPPPMPRRTGLRQLPSRMLKMCGMSKGSSSSSRVESVHEKVPTKSMSMPVRGKKGGSSLKDVAGDFSNILPGQVE
eukprot:gb/GFBE01061451.1/.p1 GENE.gb/GFBE01061451.1/~~gb/GFBE01061451.1/.p1  ORF type:complete len:237 (+),score=51.98 gb/GFBE01061451.1/:1-711(+)